MNKDKLKDFINDKKSELEGIKLDMYRERIVFEEKMKSLQKEEHHVWKIINGLEELLESEVE